MLGLFFVENKVSFNANGVQKFKKNNMSLAGDGFRVIKNKIYLT